MPSDLELEYKHLDEVSSTNDYLRNLSPEADVTVAVAQFQTRGRGQQGNTWVSNRGENLLFSVLVQPTALHPSDAFVLSQAMALAIKEALSKHLEGVQIKWPNDIYCHGQKICGTLIENTLDGSGIARSIIGSGVNVNQTEFPDGLAAPATSMRRQLGHEVSTENLLQDIILRFTHYYAKVQVGLYVGIRELYHRDLYRRGEQCTFQDQAGQFRGVIDRVEPSGLLVIIDSDQRERCYAFKEVKLVQM